MGVAEQRADDAATTSGAPEHFRAWWCSLRRDLVMAGTTGRQSFVARWWGEMAPSLRAYLAHEAGLDAPHEVHDQRWDSLTPDDRNRLLITARTVFLELRPSSWL